MSKKHRKEAEEILNKLIDRLHEVYSLADSKAGKTSTGVCAEMLNLENEIGRLVSPLRWWEAEIRIRCGFWQETVYHCAAENLAARAKEKKR